VIDNGYHVRYIGINTPETKHPRKTVEYYGREASEYNKSLVEGKTITLEYDIQKFDRYGRVLAYVYAKDTFVNAKLVEEGFAQASTIPPNVKHAGHFLNLQRAAKASKKGLWLTK
jgi:micrococcal nuclease